ncbi:hypothetical protein A5724_06050 [Mycobacterium sp. ACS1612]|uniref:DUF4012 domain-containing protein n=1 Tax=Mycobacterium sp. ACS1612 TaxID=1834117 RepID=UPI0007FD1CCB|nr:DUF4012 domain-containing protein [Mycobacterium sp. ACS1612]OBF41127.1 hypothetical protein A5724_06050 [Mycobacterium sp. ACS1612]
MDDELPEDSNAPFEKPRPRWRSIPRGRRLVAGAGLLLLLVIAFAGWLGYQATQAKSYLEQARSDAQQAKDALSKANAGEATRWADAAQEHARQAQDATHSIPWNIASVVPWLGSPFKSGQQISDVVLGLASDVLKPSVDVAEALSPEHLLSGNGRVDVALLSENARKLDEISVAATNLDAQAKSITDPAYLSAIGDARSALQTQTSDLAELLHNTALAGRLAGPMMGADGPRAYFIGFQTNAEARGTGGLIGGFGILEFNNGTASVDTLGQNIALERKYAPIDLGEEFNKEYGFNNPTTDFRNSNYSSHFPYTGRIWQSMWEQISEQRVNGAISIDPVALSYILGAVGSVTMPDGEVITADNVVELTENTSYVRFADNNEARKQYLQDVAAAVVRKMTGHLESPRALLDALGKSVSEGRIAVWSANPDEQRLLEETPLAHIVPDDPAPFASVVINNLGGNKLDYYLTRQIEYSAGACDSDTRKSAVTVRLTNTVPDVPLPEYIAGSGGLRELTPDVDLPWATNATSVRLLATKGATLTGVFVNGMKVPSVFGGMERGHPTFEVQVGLQRGQPVVIRYELSEPTTPGQARVPVQPLRDDPTPKVSVPTCSG